MNRSRLSHSILVFCDSYPVIKVLQADSIKNMEKMFGIVAKSMAIIYIYGSFLKLFPLKQAFLL